MDVDDPFCESPIEAENDQRAESNAFASSAAAAKPKSDWDSDIEDVDDDDQWIAEHLDSVLPPRPAPSVSLDTTPSAPDGPSSRSSDPLTSAVPNVGASSDPPSVQTAPRRIAGGIKNSGNTCYAAASVQALMATPYIVKALGKHAEVCRHKDGCLACAIFDLIRTITVSKTGDIKAVRRILQRLRPSWTWGRQHDAHEFLVILLELMANTGVTGDAVLSQTLRYGENIGANVPSLLKCTGCNISRHPPGQNDACWLFTTVGLGSTVEQSIEELTESEEMDSPIECETCGRWQKTTRVNQIASVGAVFPLQLRRFRQLSNDVYERVDDPVTVTKNITIRSHVGEASAWS